MHSLLHEHACFALLTEQRRQLILQMLQRDGRVVARSLADTLGLSEDTIRRDLRELASQGALQRVHGGALPSSPAVVDLQGRSRLATDEKRTLGRAAALLIEPGQVILVDGGTTTLELVRSLAPTLEATIITHSPVIAAALITHPSVQVIMIGGPLFKHSGVAVGAAAHDAISSLRADTYFMGATGVHPEHGITTGDLEEAYIKRALTAAAAETVLLATSDKLGKVSPYRVNAVRSLSLLLVTSAASKSSCASLREQGVEVRCCD